MIHGRRGQHFAEEQCGQPAGPLFHHRKHADLEIRSVERFHTAEFLDVLRRLLFRQIENVIDGDNPNQHIFHIHDRENRDVVFFESGDGGFLVGGFGKLEGFLDGSIYATLGAMPQGEMMLIGDGDVLEGTDEGAE